MFILKYIAKWNACKAIENGGIFKKVGEFVFGNAQPLRLKKEI